MKRHKMYFAALLMSGPAMYSGKYFLSGTCKMITTRKCQFGMKIRWCRQTFVSLLLKTSILLIIDVRRNQQELIMLSNSTRESAILVCSTDHGIRIPKRGRMTNEDALSWFLQWHLIVLAERGTKYDNGYALKQSIHFFRSERWPPTSNMCIL